MRSISIDGNTVTLLEPSGVDSTLVAIGSSVYAIIGGALFVSDGTTAGTSQVGSIAFAGPTTLVAAGNQLFVLANDPATSVPTVWVVDGSTQTAIELTATNGSVTGISDLTAVGNKLYFVAFDVAAAAYRLWVSDGTAAGTTEVTSAPFDPADLTADGNTLYFQAYDPTHGTQFWSTDGTAAGTTLLSNISAGSGSPNFPSNLTVVGSLAFFTEFDAATNATMLWRTDGTAAGTSVVLPSSGNYSGVSAFAAIGSEVYFVTSNPAETELWKTDGTAAGTTNLGTIGSLAYLGNTSQTFVAAGGAIFLQSGSSLLALTAGATAPTALSGNWQGPEFLATAGNYAYFEATSPSTSQLGLYRSDGTDSGTTLVATLPAAGDYSDVTVVNGSIYLLAYNPSSGDLTPFQVVGDSLQSVTTSGNAFGVYSITGVGSQLFLAANGPLWVTNGTSTTAVAVIPASGNFSDGTADLTAVGNKLFFIGTNTSYATQLWESDGTSAGTKVVVPATGSFTNPQALSTDGTSLYFWATDQAGNQSFWKTNGTPSGTTEISTGNGTFTGYSYAGVVTMNGTTLFDAYAGSASGLWSTNGTSAGTAFIPTSPPANYTYVTDITAGPTASSSTAGIAIDGYLAGATVFADANGNGKWDPGEAETTTDANGNFTLTGGSGPLVLIGGTDLQTGLAFTGTLTAPSGSTVVTPLTTVVQALLTANPGQTEAAAEQQVETAFGITLGSGQTLDSLDPIAGVLASTTGAAAAFAAQAQVLDSIDLIGSALTGIDPSLSSSAAATNVLSAITTEITANPNQPINLASAAQVSTIITNASTLDPSITSPPAADLIAQLGTIVSASNNAVQQGVANATTPQQALQDGSAVEQVAQGNESAALNDTSQINTTAANYTGTALTQAVDTAQNSVTVPCYCAGTLILTDRGSIPVERLSIGDHVVTASGVSRPIVWIGEGRALVTRNRRTAATPVIIKRHALGDNIPNADLRITKGHSIFAQGVLIPAEYLVNHRSIVWDDHAQEVVFYHIELETHDIMLANGAPAESYRDDGNRWLFRNANDGWHLPPKEPCAPVLTGGPIVDAVWRSLLDRAGPRPGFPLTTDPDLHILVDGKRVDVIARSRGTYRFPLDGRASTVKIMSRSGVPAELGLVRDPRTLGIALRRIEVRHRANASMVEASDPSLIDGFHDFEPTENLRWTNGEATLPEVLVNGFGGPLEIVLHVAGETHYPLSESAAAA